MHFITKSAYKKQPWPPLRRILKRITQNHRISRSWLLFRMLGCCSEYLPRIIAGHPMAILCSMKCLSATLMNSRDECNSSQPASVTLDRSRLQTHSIWDTPLCQLNKVWTILQRTCWHTFLSRKIAAVGAMKHRFMSHIVPHTSWKAFVSNVRSLFYSVVKVRFRILRWEIISSLMNGNCLGRLSFRKYQRFSDCLSFRRLPRYGLLSQYLEV